MTTSFRKSSFAASLLLVGMLALSSCGAGKTIACIDKTKISDGPCTMEYNPVCGCNGVTYGNPCTADRAGVTSYAEGECAKK
ncbi:Kazal-type serine protease inhibitor [Aequorivita sp. SDUM287046]|uniref:Kazal-type serine protease inhibitor n=1 Tax=Aequorivita aurantiaca TaxID=3053356 RepID=A0ABT8DGE4_9FLAO|nr:Kazal-type serine protease inhibitor [Aequorivita aurantiaca]MDN3724436.1 Kazal-type serine protease inhibitor [Aequorivita aurantiaca]